MLEITPICQPSGHFKNRINEQGIKNMTENTGYFIEDLEVGMSAEYERQVTEADIQKFAEVSGDTNPIHLNEEYSKGTVFKSRIAHGMLSAGFISTVVGTILPGPGAIYVSQSLKFKAPVRIGDIVLAKCTVTAVNAERKRVTLSSVCTIGDTIVIDGESQLMVPSKT
jgi:3-hydroxybutyryl-CoA dehydratase